MEYREHDPPAELRPWLACLWERGPGGGSPVRVLPDGCIDVVFTRGGLGTQIVGANTTAFTVAVGAGTHIAGARCKPGAAPALLGLDAELVRDERVAIDRVLGGPGARLAEALEAGGDPLAVLRTWLSERADRARRPDGLVSAVVAHLDGDADRIGSVARELGVSERALRRRVTSAVGYGPKRLGRVLRLWRALAAARAGDDLGRVAFDAGYADQAHFSSDCRALAGVPPSVLLSES